MFLKKIFIYFILFILFPNLSNGQGILIESGAHLVAKGTVGLVVNDGNFTNNGGLSTAPTSTIYMKGSVASDSAKIAGTGGAGFTNIVIDKTNNGVQLERTIFCWGNLQMLNGDLNLNGNDIHFINYATILNETASNRIWGTSGELIYTFNLNAPNNVNPANLGLHLTSADNLGTFTIRRGHQVQSINGASSMERYYKINYFNTGFSVDYTFDYFDTELNGHNENHLSTYTNDGNWNQQNSDSLNTNLNFMQIIGASPVDTFWAFSPGKIRISPKVLLQGNYVGAGLMNDNLRTKNLIPTTEPYTGLGYTHIGGGGEMIDPSVLNVTGDNAIVDWVFLELRDKANSTLVLATRSALLQKDGDIVDVDGISSVGFGAVAPDNYYVVVRHRNHLGIRTPTVQSISPTATTYDFTSNTTQAFGSNSMAALAGGGYGLWGGDANGDGKIYDNAIPSDAQEVSGAVLAHPGNTGFFGSGPVSNYSGFTDTYDRRDLNMDGNIYDNFVPSDNTIISNSVLGHPSNTGFFGSGPVTNFSGLIEQIDP